MFEVAVCDGEASVRESISKGIEHYSRDSGENFRGRIFTSGSGLWTELVAGKRFDLLFLNMELQGINGVSLGKKLREDLDDQMAEIVFISNQRQKAAEAYQVRPRSFLSKPIEAANVCALLYEIVGVMHDNRQWCEFRIKHETVRLQYQEIICVCNRGIKTEVTSTKGHKMFFGKGSQLVADVLAHEFVRVHRHCVVNYRYIAQFHSGHVILTNGTAILMDNQNQVLDDVLEIHRQRKRWRK